MEGIEHNEIGLPGLQDSGHGVEEVVEVDRSHHGAGAGHLGRWVFSSPVSGAGRNQHPGFLGSWYPDWRGLDLCSCPRLQACLSKEPTPEGPCSDPAGPCPIQESSSRAVTRMATTGRCSVTRAVVTAGVWTSWAWS